jgi:hypothetical protein
MFAQKRYEIGERSARISQLESQAAPHIQIRPNLCAPEQK